MGIYSVLGTALQGLAVTSAGLEVVSRNVANADTPGYTKKTLGVTSLVVGGVATGVLAGDVKRQVDSLLQRQIRQENAGLGYVRILENYYGQIDQMYGEPGQSTAIDTLYNTFQTSLESLATSPDSYIAREQFLRDAQVLAERLNDMSDDVQTMRLQTERDIGDTVTQINDLLDRLAQVNSQLGSSSQVNTPPADLLDTRDRYINELSQLIDINVTEGERGIVRIMTGSGTSLLDPLPAQLQFDERGTITAQSLYDPDSSVSGVGSITIVTPNGGKIDLIADNQIRSGKLAALLELRDEYLVDAQAQLDSIADALARSLSTIGVDSTAVTSGTQAGFDIDLAGMQPGDSVSMTYMVDGVERSVTLVAVDGTSSLPLSNDVTGDPDDTVIGIDISGGIAAVAAQINAQLNPQVDVSSVGGDVLRFLDDGDATASSAGALYGADGSTLNLAALAGESITVSVNGVDNTFNFTGAETGQDLQVWIDGLGGVNASVVAGELVINGDTATDGFAISFSDPSVGTATGLSEGSYNTSGITALSAGITQTSLSGNGLAIPLFTDGVQAYTANQDGLPQQLGFAQRISINPDILDDNSLLVLYDASTLAGDAARPAEMLRRLTELDYTFSAETKVAGATPYQGTIDGFIQRVISYQGAISNDIYQAAQAQETVSAQLEERFASDSGVNIDEEMAHLIELQTAYQANTRVITVFREMMDMLLRI
jgi:flagellar hook-associated protein 1